MLEEKRNLKLECFKYLSSYGEFIRAKFDNICGKTGRYNVPEELFQERTSRKNRSLISWKSVKKNNINMEMLNSFENGIVVEFTNNDYFNTDNQNDETFIELKNRLGSDENVSSIISFRSEDGSSSSAIQRSLFTKFLDNTEVIYKDRKVIINESNYKDYALKKLIDGSGSGSGNNKWSGFLYVSIKGGKQDSIETHNNANITLFNPACEYASKEISLDIDLTLAYFAMRSIDINNLPEDKKTIHNSLINRIEKILKETTYDLNGKDITLYQYCNMHPSMAINEEKLYDPIQIKDIQINKFNIKSSSDPESIDLTHNEAVNKEIYYWDGKRKSILTPARPTNLFWSYHFSNMMQQDFNLSGYIEYEKEIYNKRQEFKEFFDFTNDI